LPPGKTFGKPHPPTSVWRRLRPSSVHPRSPEQHLCLAARILFGGPNFVPDEQKIFAVLRADEPTHIDESVERLVAELSSSQIFAARFEQELSSRIHTLPGKYYVRVI